MFITLPSVCLQEGRRISSVTQVAPDSHCVSMTVLEQLLHMKMHVIWPKTKLRLLPKLGNNT